ncbi:MAG TPA: MFS transporter [Stenomitos sp.]
MAIQSYREVLGNAPFLFLWMSQLLSQVADKVFFVLLVSLVTEHSPSHAMVSLALIANGLPAVLFGLPAGVLVDRSDKRRTLMATNWLRALALAVLPLVAQSPWAIVLLSFAIATCSQPFAPAEAATIPMVVPRSNLMTANALFSTTMVVSIILGFTLAEPLLGTVGSTWLALGTAAMYLLAGVCDLGVRYPPEIRHEGRTVRDLLDELKEGWQYIRRERPIRGAIVGMVTLFAMFAGMSVLAILFAKAELRVPFSWFLAVAGLGMALGSAAVSHWGGNVPRRLLVNGGFLVTGLALWALSGANAQTVPLAFGLAALIGAASASVVLPLQTELQERVPDRLRGKVFGAQNMATNIATAGPIAGVGLLADAVGVRMVFGLMGALMLVAAAWGWWRSRKVDRNPA